MILSEKTPFLAFPEAKKGVVHCTRLRKSVHWPNNNANPSGLSQKKFIVYKVCDFVDKVGISVFRRVGLVPQKSAGFGATAQHKSTPDPVAAPKNIPFGTIFIEFGDTKKCCTFSGLELAPKSRKKLIGALSCMHKAPKCIQSLWDHPKKIPFVQKHKEGRYVRSLGKKPHFSPSQRLKKVLFTAQGCARLRTGLIITQIPRGYQKKKFIV